MTNLLNIFSVLSELPIDNILDEFSHKGKLDFKSALTDLLVLYTLFFLLIYDDLTYYYYVVYATSHVSSLVTLEYQLIYALRIYVTAFHNTYIVRSSAISFTVVSRLGLVDCLFS